VTRISYLIVGLTLGLIAQACCYFGHPDADTTVVVVGDSIVEGSEVEWYDTFITTEQYAIFVRAVRGATGEKMIDDVEAFSLAGYDPADVTVIMVGTNDWTRANSSGDWVRWEQSLRDVYAASTSACVIGVVPWLGQEWSRPILESVPNIAGLVDWDLAVNADPSLILDAVGHPSAAGQVVIADLALAKVQEACGE
jgi:hypothetical protein